MNFVRKIKSINFKYYLTYFVLFLIVIFSSCKSLKNGELDYLDVIMLNGEVFKDEKVYIITDYGRERVFSKIKIIDDNSISYDVKRKNEIVEIFHKGDYEVETYKIKMK